MKKTKVHCPTWVIFEEKFAICVRQALRPLQIASPKTLEEIMAKVMPKLTDRLRLVRPEVVREEVLRQIIEMGLLSEKDAANALAQIQLINQDNEKKTNIIVQQ